MLHFTTDHLKTFERFYRANLINGISGFKPAALIGTKSGDGVSNLAIFSSVVHLGADPALIGFIQRPVGVSGDTYRNILETGYYTINHVEESTVDRAHYTSARFDAGVSEFEACGFTEEYLGDFFAPFVRESPIRIGLQFAEEFHIRRNDTRLIIGEIRHLTLPEESLLPDGNVDLNRAGVVSVSGLAYYHKPARIGEFPYARVVEVPKF